MFLILLSPSKKLSFSTPIDEKINYTKPLFTSEASLLASICKEKNVNELKSFMKISDKLAQQVHDYFTIFDTSDSDYFPAIYGFSGDTFVGLEPTTLKTEEILQAQNQIRILSGMYGLLRPLDRIQGYRLEMGAKLENPKGKDLHSFWQDIIRTELLSYIKDNKIKAIINLASVEYSEFILKEDIYSVPIITPSFKKKVGGTLKNPGMMTKRYRGAMARYIIQNRVNNIKGLCNFNLFNFRLEDDKKWLFVQN